MDAKPYLPTKEIRQALKDLESEQWLAPAPRLPPRAGTPLGTRWRGCVSPSENPSLDESAISRVGRSDSRGTRDGSPFAQKVSALDVSLGTCSSLPQCRSRSPLSRRPGAPGHPAPANSLLQGRLAAQTPHPSSASAASPPRGPAVRNEGREVDDLGIVFDAAPRLPGVPRMLPPTGAGAQSSEPAADDFALPCAGSATCGWTTPVIKCDLMYAELQEYEEVFWPAGLPRSPCGAVAPPPTPQPPAALPVMAAALSSPAMGCRTQTPVLRCRSPALAPCLGQSLSPCQRRAPGGFARATVRQPLLGHCPSAPSMSMPSRLASAASVGALSGSSTPVGFQRENSGPLGFQRENSWPSGGVGASVRWPVSAAIRKGLGHCRGSQGPLLVSAATAWSQTQAEGSAAAMAPPSGLAALQPKVCVDLGAGPTQPSSTSTPSVRPPVGSTNAPPTLLCGGARRTVIFAPRTPTITNRQTWQPTAARSVSAGPPGRCMEASAGALWGDINLQAERCRENLASMAILSEQIAAALAGAGFTTPTCPVVGDIPSSPPPRVQRPSIASSPPQRMPPTKLSSSPSQRVTPGKTAGRLSTWVSPRARGRS